MRRCGIGSARQTRPALGRGWRRSCPLPAAARAGLAPPKRVRRSPPVRSSPGRPRAGDGRSLDDDQVGVSSFCLMRPRRRRSSRSVIGTDGVKAARARSAVRAAWLPRRADRWAGCQRQGSFSTRWGRWWAVERARRAFRTAERSVQARAATAAASSGATFVCVLSCVCREVAAVPVSATHLADDEIALGSCCSLRLGRHMRGSSPRTTAAELSEAVRGAARRPPNCDRRCSWPAWRQSFP
jgi:hypothetical protein